MPSPDTLSRFVAAVQAARFLRAIDEFYAPDATMQENQHPPRAGKATLLAHERQTPDKTRRVIAACVGPVLVNGDPVVMRWQFEFESLDGSLARIDELAWQRWQGEQIVQEQFFYDPAQMKAAA